MKSLLLLTFVFVVAVGCDSKKEDCYYNGQKVSCDQMPRKSEQNANENLPAETVQAKARGLYEIKNGQFKALTDIKITQTKKVKDMTYDCSVNIEINKPFPVRINEREMAFTQDGQELILERIGNQKVDYANLNLGIFENMDTENRIRLTLNFISNDTLEVTSTCYFN